MDEQKLLNRRRKALKENNESALVVVCTELAALYVEEGRYDSAVEQYEIVANIHQKHKRKLEYAIVNRGIGEAYLGLRKFEEALHYLKLYLEIAKELDNQLEKQRAFASIGHFYLTSYLTMAEPDKENLHSAYKYFMKSLKVCENLSEEISKVDKIDMSARLLYNLGLVQDSLGDYTEAVKLINNSINLCKDHDIYEQLQRGYMFLGSTLEKQGDNRQALQQYNSAVEVSKKLRNKPDLLAAAFMSKSEILIKLGDFKAAKYTLRKAYLLKIANKKDRETIETNLRIVAFMCKKEEQLIKTEATNYITLKKLYEKMGDGACELKCYKEAIEYYKKMLDAAKKAEMSDTDLATCYNSLAETYRDNGQLEEAVLHFEEEIKFCPALKDYLDILSNIADVKETAECPVSEVQAVYLRAIEYCKKKGNLHEEGRMLKRFIHYLRRQNKHSEAYQREQDLLKLNYNSSDSEGSEPPAGSVLGEDINLDEITDVDVSDDSNPEQPPPTRGRRRNKNYIPKRNPKGETPLHVACIQGKLNVVKHQLELGHPVNVRDYCGWLPLHEACNRGYIEIVQALLEKGAVVNDRGGPQCDGVTPMHDAATNGHLELVQLLLDKGANAVAKTDNGDTVLDFLKAWRLKNPTLSPEDEALYQSLVDQMTQALDKAGYNNNKEQVTAETSALSLEKTEEFTRRRPSAEDRRRSLEEKRRSLEEKRKSEERRRSLEDERKSINMRENIKNKKSSSMRRSTTVGLEDGATSDSDSNIAEDYRNVMNSLRHKNKTIKTPKKSTVSKRPALIAADEVVDDWLEDDIGKTHKRRKTGSPSKSDSSRSPTPSSTKSRNQSRLSDVILLEKPPDIQMLVDSDSEPDYNRPSTSKSPVKFKKKRTYQTKLTNFGHTRNLVEADSTSSPSVTRKRNLDSTKRSSFDNTLPPITQPVIDPTLSVDVRIDEKLYRVPVLLSQVNTHTIKWLADEAAARYARKEYMVPTLELETKNGAILADDDLVSLLFPMGSTQAEQVEARIIKWNVPPLFERYKEACQDMSVETNGTLRQILQEFSVALNLSNKGLKGTSLAPLCKVLIRQSNLLELHLSGNFLSTECVRFLSSSIASLPNLYKLNLSCTGLVAEHLQLFANNLLPDSSYKLTDLDLSDNQIGDDALESLDVLTRRFKLKKLNLSGNNFTRNLFSHSLNKNCSLILKEVEEFDISDNSLSNEATIKILTWLEASNLKILNVSRNSITHGFLRDLLAIWGELNDMKWQTLKLSRCCVHDSDLFDLLRMSNTLETLDLSYNNELTSISLRRLLQCQPLINLELYGCSNIFKYFTELGKYVEQPLEDQKGKTIKLSVDLRKNAEESEYLCQMWREMYGNKSRFEQSSRFLCLSVSK